MLTVLISEGMLGTDYPVCKNTSLPDSSPHLWDVRLLSFLFFFLPDILFVNAAGTIFLAIRFMNMFFHSPV